MEITPAPSRKPPQLDAQNPWPGLAAYDETSQDFFHGREENADELLRLIRQAPLTVLYSKSGLGKSSLLQAGLFPRLRLKHFLPVYLHVDFSEKADCPPFEQVARRLDTAIKDAGADCPPRAPGEDLWHYLHRKGLEIWSPDNYPLTPVLVFDQLEELFSSSSCGRDPIQSVLDKLADLIENRIPPELTDADRVRREQIDMFSQRYRILLAFREDFLPEVETWKDKVPALLRNRLRLLPMSRERAIAAIQQAGKAILDKGVAERIVDFIANHEAGACDIETGVEPVLLSLCCYQLNLKRIQAQSDMIDATLVDKSGEDILEDFYHEAIKGMPENVPKFIETYLILGNRSRGNYPRKDALDNNYIQEEELERLTGKFRLLRVNQQADTPRIELIHDRLVGVVRKARDKRVIQEREQEKERRQKEEEREKLAQIDRERRVQAERDMMRIAKMRNRLFVAVLSLLVLVGFVAYQTKVAKDQGLRATSLCLVAEAQAMLSGARIESDERAFFQLLAAFRISPEAISEAKSKVEMVLLDTLFNQRDLVKIMMTGGPAIAVAFSPDGSRIASGATDKTFHQWDVVTGRIVSNALTGHGDVVSCMAFSPDGTRIVSGSEDNAIRLWDAVSGKPANVTLTGHNQAVSCVAFSPDGTRIVSGGWDKTLRLWNAGTGEIVGELKELEKTVMSVAFSPDGTRIVSGSEDNAIRLWDANTFQPIAQPMLGHEEPVSCVAFSPDGSRIVSGSWDKTLRLWDVVTGKTIGLQQLAHKGAVRSVGFSPDGSRIVSGGQDNALRLWDAKLSAPLHGHVGWVNCVAFSPDGKCIVSGSGDETLRLWDANTGQPVGEPLFGHSDAVNSVAFSPDGSRIVSGSGDNTLRLWNAATGEPIGKPLTGHAKAVKTVAFSLDGNHIVSGSDDCSLRLWDANTGQPVGEPLLGHSDAVNSVAFSPDGSRIVSGSGDNTLRLWNAVTGEPIGKPLTGFKSWVMSVAFSPDNNHMASGSWDNTLSLWTAVSMGQPLKGHEDAVMSVAFSPDGTRIVSGSWDTSLRLWDAAALRQWNPAAACQPIGLTLKGHTGKVQSVAFSPDGTRIVSGSADNTLRLWPVPTDLPGELCKKLTRNMSRREWRDWVSPDIGYEIQCPGLPIPQDKS